jgi:integrase
VDSEQLQISAIFIARPGTCVFRRKPEKAAFPRIDPANCKTLFRTSRGRIGGLELPPKMVQQRMGHASIAITMDVYGHLFPRGDDGAELAAAEKALLPVAS